MNSDYLWDKSGEPDPEVQKLENLLAPLGHRAGKMPVWPSPWRRRAPLVLAIAASVLVILSAAWLLRRPRGPAWQVAIVQGKPSVTRLAQGQTLHTDANSRARLDMDDVGEVQVEPNTHLSVVATRPDEQRLALEHGAIHAVIWAPPGRFFVNTPSAQTVDLGCEYTLQVDNEGIGLVRVSVGWVAFESDGRESFIPAAAACATRPKKGPGIPYYEDAPAALVDAVHRFDSDSDQPAVGVILSAARARDGITLWHLLRRVAPEDRGRVYDRLVEFVKPPAAVSREGVIAGDPKMIDALWDQLDLGNTAWWRMWKSRMR